MPLSGHPRETTKVKIHQGLSFPNRMALVPFEEKELILSIDSIVSAAIKDGNLTIDIAKLAISRWVAEVYDKLSKETFSGYFSLHLSYPDAKVFFTHNMALNFQNMIEYFWKNHPNLWARDKGAIIRHFEDESLNTLEFMMIKYPQKKKINVSE
jgi:hypothetical protein